MVKKRSLSSLPVWASNERVLSKCGGSFEEILGAGLTVLNLHVVVFGRGSDTSARTKQVLFRGF